MVSLPFWGGMMPIPPVVSPYFASHPEYQPTLGLVGFDYRAVSSREVGRLTLLVNGYVEWQSGEVEINSLHSVQLPRLRRRDGRTSLRLYLDYTRFFHGQPYYVRVRLPVNVPKFVKNFGRVTSSATRARYRPFVRKARRSTASMVSPTRAARTLVPRASNLRPSPEQSFRPFVKVLENFGISGPGVYSLTETAEAQVAFQRTWSGVRTPNFGRIRKSSLPVNPHSVSIKTVGANWVADYSGKLDGSNYHNQVRQYTTVYAEPGAPIHAPLARNNAIRKLIDKAELGVSANLAQDFAQIGQTFKVITNSALRIAKSVSQLKRGNIPAAVRALTTGRSFFPTRVGNPSVSKTLAQNWLELQYGWKPLLQDIEGVLQSLPVLSSQGGFVQRVVASGRADLFSDFRENATGTPGLPPNSRRTVSHLWTTCRFVLRYKLSSPLQAFLSQTGFTPNPISLAWEILPFSFVVDWFLPIGPYLEALHAFDGLEFLDGSQTLFTRMTTACSVDTGGVQIGNPTSFAMEHARFYAEYVLLDRTKLTSFPTPTFPSLKNGLASVTHAVNAIALLKSVFGR